MKTLASVVLVVAIFIPLGSHATTTEQTWRQAYCEAVDFDQQGRWPEARRAAQLALRKADYGFGRNSLNAAKSHMLLRDLYAKRGKFVSAEMHYVRGVKIRDGLFGPNHASTARPMTSLAELYVSQGEYDQARESFSRAISARRSLDDPGVAKALAGLAGLEASDGKFEASIGLLEETLRLCQNSKKYGNELCRLEIRSLIDLAAVHMTQGKYLQALNQYGKALELVESTRGPEGQPVYSLLTRLGDAHRDAGSPTLASNYYRRAAAARTPDRSPVITVMGSAQERLPRAV